MKIVDLKVEYLDKPLGIDILQPRFFYSVTEGNKQSAYQIICKSADQVLWDSGKVESDCTNGIAYEGEALTSCQKVDVEVTSFDENDQPSAVGKTAFEMGLLNPQDWQAKWISAPIKPKKNQRYPADYFKKTFHCDKEIVKARLYISACGIYQAYINGKRVGDFELAPGSTDYRKRIQYQTYDVTEMIHKDNELSLVLSDGWYRGSIGCFGVTNVFGRQSSILAQLEINYSDSSVETIVSDESFLWSNDGAIRFADLKDGEEIIAGQEPSYKDKAVLSANQKMTSLLCASNNVFPTQHEHFKAKLLTTPSGKKVLDFSQNLAGFIRFRVKGQKGQQIHLTMGEILDEKGEFTQKNMVGYKPVKEMSQLQLILTVTGNGDKLKCEKQPTPRQEILFTCSGGEDEYVTFFAVFGFRYALIETEIEINAEDFEAIAVYSDLTSAGTFECSDDRINQLFKNATWSMKSNFLDVPTDCPTRERLGWTGDAQIFFNTASYMTQCAPFYRKWLQDLEDNQFKDGKISAVVPYNGASMVYDNTGTSAGWSDCAILLPYYFWKKYHDDRIIEDCYDMMSRNAHFMISHIGCKDRRKKKENPLYCDVYEHGVQLGEWLEPDCFKDQIAAGKMTAHTEEATAYFSYSLRCLSEMAQHLNKKADAELFKNYSEKAKAAYQKLFIDSGSYDSDRQAKMVRPLALGLCDEQQKEKLQYRLIQAVENFDYCVGTGFLSTVFLLPMLCEAGRSDLAYKMLKNEKSPSWLSEINQGATSIWENWEGDCSNNHYSPGAVCQWFFEGIGGIHCDRPNHFMIQPVIDPTMAFAKVGYESLYGKVEVQWKNENNKTVLNVHIPANCSAEIKVNNKTKTYKNGDYIIDVE